MLREQKTLQAGSLKISALKLEVLVSSKVGGAHYRNYEYEYMSGEEMEQIIKFLYYFVLLVTEKCFVEEKVEKRVKAG